MIEFGIYNSGRVGATASYPALKQVWLEAERLGLEYAFCADNVVGPVGPGAESTEVIDFWNIAGAIAEATTRIRIGPWVTPSGRRHPALFAKMTSMLDVISGGRLELGMGCGDYPTQFTQWGMDFPEKASDRIKMLREEIDILKLMWTQEQSWYKGKHYRLDGACNSPKPTQKPHPKVWLAINRYGTKILPRLTAEVADGFIITLTDDEEIKRRLATIAKDCRELGRDPASLRKGRVVRLLITDEDVDLANRCADEAKILGVQEGYLAALYSRERRVLGPTDRAIDDLKNVIDMGFDLLVFRFGGGVTAGPEAWIKPMRVFAEDIMPALRAHAESKSRLVS